MANLQIVIVARNMAGGALRELNGELRDLDNHAGFASRGITGLQGAVRAGLAAAATAGTVAVGALGAGLLVAANKAGDFEAQINILAVAARQSGTSMDDLRAAAMAVGSDVTLVGISSAEAADAMTGFYRAGMTTTDIMGDLQSYLAGTTPLTGALRAAIDLAAASELDLAASSNLVTVAMNTFGLSAGDAAGIANTLVGAADASVASVSGLGDALGNVGPVAAAMGMSLNETSIALALLSTRGIEGSEAGTALRSMLLNLQSGTPAVTAALQGLNVALYDQAGNMLPLPNIIGQLQTAMAGMTSEQRNQTMQTLAGTYGLRALNTLVAEGTPGWDAMAAAVANAATAQEVAAARTQGFNAAMENLGGVIETFLIGVGTPLIQNFLTPGISLLAQWIGNLQTMTPSTDQVSTAFETLLGIGQQVLAWIAATVGPVVSLIGQFVSWQDVLIVLGGVIASVLIGGLVSIVSAAAPVIAVFAALVLAVALLRTAWETDFGGIRTFVESTIATVTGILTGLATYIQTHSAQATQWLTTAWAQIQTFVSDAVTAVGAIIQGILTPVQTFLQNHSAEIQAFLIGAWQTIGNIVTGVLAILQATIIPVLQGIATFIAAHSAEIEAVLSAAWVVIRTIIETVLAVIEGIIRTVLAIIRGDWDTAWAEIRNIADTVWNAIVTIIETVFGPIVTWIAEKLEQIRGWFVTKWNEIKANIQTKIDEIKTAIQTWLQNMLSTIQNFDLGAAARALFQKVVTGIASKVGEALETVAGFLDDAFVAIESFDLKAAAQTFFGTTLPGIATKAAEALRNVGDWLRDTFDRIREKDLKGAAESMFQTAISGIVAKARDALREVGDWLRDTGNKVKSFDLKGAAMTMFGTVIPGLLTKAAQALQEVATFLFNIGKKIAGADFKSQTMTAIQTVIVGIVQKAVDILLAVATFLGQIATAIREFSLHDVGVALIQGLIGGVQSMAGALVAAAQGVVSSAIQAAKNLLGIGSPSRVFREIGTDTMRGMVIGIEEMAGALVAAMQGALGEVTVEAAEQAAAIADAVSTMIDTMLALIDAAGAMVAFEVPAGLTAAVDEIAEQMAYVVERFVATVADFEMEGVDAAVALAEAAGTIGENIGSAIEGMLAAWQFRLPMMADGTDQLFEALRRFVARLQYMAENMDYQAFEAALRFADAAGRIGQGISDAIGAMLAAWQFRLPAMEDGTDQLFEALRRFVARLQYMAENMDYQAFEAALRFADAAGRIGQGISDAIEAMLAAWEFRLPRMADGTDLLFETLRQFVARLETMAQLMDYQAFDAAIRFAEAAGTIGSNISDALDGLGAALGYQGGLAEAALDAFVADMQMLVRAMETAGLLFTEDGLAAAAALAEAAGSIGSNVGDALEGLGALLDYQGGLAQTALDAFVADMLMLVRAMETAGLLFTEDGLAAAAALAEAAGSIGSNVGDALEGLGALLDYQGGLAQAALDAFVADMVLVVNALTAAAALVGAAGMASAIGFANQIRDITASVSAAMQSMRTILGYESGQTAALMAAFLADVREIVLRLDEARMEMGAALVAAEQIELDGAAIGAAIGAGIMAATSTPAGVPAALAALAGEMSAAMAVMAAQFTAMKNAAWGFGRDWVLMLINGLEARLPDLVALLAYIRGLFPSSPAKYGAWRTLPDGAVVGRGFGQDLAVSLSRQQRPVAAAMDKLRRELALAGGVGPIRPFEPAPALNGARPMLTTAGGSIRPPIQITISGNTFGSRDDIDYLMDEIDRRLRLKGAFRV